MRFAQRSAKVVRTDVHVAAPGRLLFIHRNVQHRLAHAHRIALRMRITHARTLQLITALQTSSTELPASSVGRALAY